MRDLITKSIWLTARRCVGMAWHAMRAEPSPLDDAERFRMEQGQEIGVLARKLFPDGVLIPAGSAHASAARTQEHIRERRTIFEATAFAPPLVARADILTPVNGGWHVLEVKSSFSDKAKKELDELTEDLAYTVMVFRRSGLPVVRASLLLLSREYRFGDEPGRLFDVVDRTPDALARAAAFGAVAGEWASALFREDPPEPKLGSVCRDCAVFGDRCVGAGHAHTVLEIPGLHYKKLQQLAADGVVDLAHLPDDLKLNERQQRAVKAANSGELVVDGDLAGALATLTWPCYYLDFETVATFLPLYEGRRCHEQVLTQFSIHRRAGISDELHHSDYLADPTRDCQREVAEALIQALGRAGSVIVYTSYEKTRIKALQERFPDLAAPLQGIVDRLWDLNAVIADHVCHPEFHGSFSIKKVLPALAPELSYDGLAIGNGTVAVTRFARMARGEITGEDVGTTRLQLLEYCKLDTLAMVRLHDRLAELAAGRITARA
jgi:hypothetical protein